MLRVSRCAWVFSSSARRCVTRYQSGFTRSMSSRRFGEADDEVADLTEAIWRVNFNCGHFDGSVKIVER